MTIKQLIRDSYKHFKDKNMRKKWVRAKYNLIKSGNYAPMHGYKWVASRKVM